MKHHLFLGLIASVAMLASLPLLNLSVTASGCKDVEFIFARGSGGNVGEENYKIWENGVISTLEGSTLDYNFYELGTSSYNGYRYPSAAIGVDNLKTIGTTVSAIFSALRVGSFNASVDAGTKEVAGRIAFVSSSCPNTRFVLAGYSQGAMTMSRAVPTLNAEKIAYVATFGDPTLYLPEGEGLNPPACRGIWYSDYRIYAPNCRTHAGMLGANKPYEPDAFAGKIGIWCTAKDLFCSNSIDLSDPISDHLAYADEGFYLDSAKKIREKLAVLFPEKFPETAVDTTVKRNTVLLIDATGSMRSKIDRFTAAALKITKDTLDNGGEVAVFTYRDINPALEGSADWQKPHLLADFGSSYDEIAAALAEIETSGGGDDPESVLSASLNILNAVKWKKGATKTIVLLTDDGFHAPDYDGATIQQVVRRSLEIDPVNFFVVSSSRYGEVYYTELVNSTGGQFFYLYADDADFDVYRAVMDRLEVNFPLENYSGTVGDEFRFSLEVSGNVSSYEWDLDGDGVFERSTTASEVSTTYTSPFDGIIQARITSSDGLVSTASAAVSVSESLEAPASLENVSATKLEAGVTELNIDAESGITELYTDSSAGNYQFNYTFGENTVAVLATVDNLPVGLTSNTSLIISDLTAESIVQLIPISDSGLYGNPIYYHISSDTVEEAIDIHAETEQVVQEINQASPIPLDTITPTLEILAPNCGKL